MTRVDESRLLSFTDGRMGFEVVTWFWRTRLRWVGPPVWNPKTRRRNVHSMWCISRPNVAETKFETEWFALKQTRGRCLWTVISKIWPWLVMSKIGLLESVTFQLQDRMVSLYSAQSLKSYGQFPHLAVEIAIGHAMLKKNIFSSKTNTAIHGPNLYVNRDDDQIVFSLAYPRKLRFFGVPL